MPVLTELEKTILLVFMSLSRGKTDKLLPKDQILAKFPIRQRKEVRFFLQKLSDKGLIKSRQNSFSLSDRGVKETSRVLLQGARIRI